MDYPDISGLMGKPARQVISTNNSLFQYTTNVVWKCNSVFYKNVFKNLKKLMPWLISKDLRHFHTVNILFFMENVT
jgi:hypothetical protein